MTTDAKLHWYYVFITEPQLYTQLLITHSLRHARKTSNLPAASHVTQAVLTDTHPSQLLD